MPASRLARPPHQPHSGGPARGPSMLGILLAGAAVFAGLALFLRAQEYAIRPEPLLEAPRLPPPQVAGVEQAVSAMQLVTVVLDTHVVVKTKDQSWMGDVNAEVRAPVRLLYGTDFSRARVESVKLGGLSTAYLVRVPAPSRIATEVYPEREESRVETGWARFRALGGEYTLGLARRSIGEEARRMVLKPEDEEMVRARTRERVVELVKAVAGEGVSVTVAFDEVAPRDAEAESAVPAAPGSVRAAAPEPQPERP